MPGILPMKLIRTGSSNQTRVAQACDRCRSKKIRCDGIRPSCTQCANVGFECKTSDKLSRRAFPRGYTESLEERVRGLETEVKELKALLDAKEEQIEMLSRIHSFSPYSPPSSVSGRSNSYKRPSEITPPPEENSADDRFTMPESSTLLAHEKSGDIFVGASSGRAFIDVFKKKAESSGLKRAEFSGDIFFAKDEREGGYKSSSSQNKRTIKAPPRMISDLLVTAFFQEYHPLFPILHRPTFLGLYGNLVDQEVSSPNYPRQDHEIAQLFLVFAIASSQTEARNSNEHEMFNRQWQKALEDLISRPTFNTLQCLLLAMLYCVSVGDYTKLMQYRSLAVSLAMRLGLNLCQKKFELSALKSEMRKRIFWSLYCLDSFTAAMLGVPTLLRDEEVDTDYPADIDDEYVSENGFLPSLPGEHSKISASIALFRASRMLSKVLATVYTHSSTQKQSFKKLQELEDELDTWKAGLAPHLRLEFVNGMPATNIVHSRSPLLVLAYHYIRVLIHRPTIGAESSKDNGGSVYALVESSKCIYQILKLLEERKLGFAFCVNKNHTLLMCGFAVMYGSIGCSQDGAIVKDSQKIISGILGTLTSAKYPLAQNLKEIASAFVKESSPSTSPKSASRTSLSPKVQAAISNGIDHIRRASSFSGGNSQQQVARRKSSTKTNVSDATPIRRVGSSGFANSNSSRTSLPPLEAAQLAMLEQCGPRASFVSDNYIGNMDMLTWANATDSLPTPSTVRPSPPTSAVSSEDWEQLVAAVDQNHGASIYGGLQSADMGMNPVSSSFKSTNSSASTLTTTAALSPPSSNSVPTSSPLNVNDSNDLNNDNGGIGISIPWSSDSWNLNQALHPTPASVSSLSNLSEEESVNLFDNENNAAYLPNFMGLGTGLDCDWLQ